MITTGLEVNAEVVAERFNDFFGSRVSEYTAAILTVATGIEDLLDVLREIKDGLKNE